MKSLLIFIVVAVSLHTIADTKKPNFIVIFTDDLGYQDVGCFGSPDIRTPNIDKMATEGMTFTSFYAHTVCGPSRAALMTGCYPLRTAKRNNQMDIHPFLHNKEITVAEVLKEQGYATGCFGKWDLAGHRQKGYDPKLLPNHQGFDYYFGTPSSNDAIINIIRQQKMIEEKASMATITKRLTDEAIGFIDRNKDNPFFVYIPHPMPHLRLDASKQFKGKSKRGLYGDVVEEIDFNVGRIIDAVKKHKLQDNTYVIFTSDNGPWFLDNHPRLSKQKDKGGSHGGDADPLRGHKTSIWEGGVRVPFVIWAPGRVPAGKNSAEISTTMDILPTLANLAGTKPPADRVIDGKNVADLWHGKDGAKSPTEAFYYYAHTQLFAVRSGKWKLHLPHKVHTMQKWNVYQKKSDFIKLNNTQLFDLEADVAESKNVAAANPEVVAELTKLAEVARNDIGDYNRIGQNARFFDPQPKRPDVKKAK